MLLAQFVWLPLDTWIIITGALCAASCALLGNFLVLRKMSMMGDAISHAVLPGLAIAFLLTGSRESLPMFIGAGVVGILTAVFTEWIRRFGRVDESAAMGVVFTAMFAAGLVLIVRGAHSVDLDPGCVLYGNLESAAMDMHSIAGVQLPRPVLTLATVLLLDALFIIALYKELKLTSFDPALATSLGISARGLHYALMTLVAITTVAAFESVGSILVIAMLIVPPATAFLITQRLSLMIALSVGIAVASAVAGHLGALTLPPLLGYQDAGTAGMIAVTAGVFFAVALLAAPRDGLISRRLRSLRLTLQIAREDALGILYRIDELGDSAAVAPPTRADVSAILVSTRGTRRIISWLALRGLLRDGRVAMRGTHLHMTDRGREEARRLVRSHRLWESYLAKHLRLPADHLHPTAERLEHVTSGAMQAHLSHDAGEAALDPQGKPIPPA